LLGLTPQLRLMLKRTPSQDPTLDTHGCSRTERARQSRSQCGC
jgi:hypothetical protein